MPGSRLHQRLVAVARRDPLLTMLLALYAALALLVPQARRPWRLVDLQAIAAITAIVVAARGLDISGALARAATAIVRVVEGKPRLQVILLTFSAALLSSVAMNDTTILVYAPMAAKLADVYGVDPTPLVALTAIAVNVGSSLTPIGNPQNIIIWHTFSPSFHQFVAAMAPFVAASLLLLAAYTALLIRGARTSVVRAPPPVYVNKRLMVVSLTAFISSVALIEAGMPYYAFAVALALTAVAGREALYSVDASIPLILALMYVDFGSLSHVLRGILQGKLGGLELLLAGSLLSQLVSNVPATILLLSHAASWRLLAVSVNLGGVGFALGSLANIIAARVTRLSALRISKYTIPYYLALTSVVILLLLLGVYS